MDVWCELHRLVPQLHYFARITQRAFERAADFRLVCRRFGELVAGIVEGPPNLALVGGWQLLENLSEFGEFCVDIDGAGSRRRLASEFGAELRVNRVAAPGYDDAARYRAGMDLIALRHRNLQVWGVLHLAARSGGVLPAPVPGSSCRHTLVASMAVLAIAACDGMAVLPGPGSCFGRLDRNGRWAPRRPSRPVWWRCSGRCRRQKP